MNSLATSVRVIRPFTESVYRPGLGHEANKTQDFWLSKDVSTRFGRRLKDLREQHHMTQGRMAAKFGIDRSFISDMERGKKAASLETLEVVALGFRLTLSDLLRGI